MGSRGELRALYFRECLRNKIQFERDNKRGGEDNVDDVEIEQLFHSVRNTTFYMDETTVDISRPGVNQRVQYNGYKKRHQISYLGLIAPDGLAIRLGGAYVGTMNDAAVYSRELLELNMQEIHDEFRRDEANQDANNEDDENEEYEDGLFTIYADAAYTQTRFMKRSFKKYRGLLHNTKKHFNYVMSSCRIHVENFFGIVKQSFKVMDDKPSFKLLSSVKRPEDAKYAFDMRVFCCVFLTNLRTCLQESQISAGNDCVPPIAE